MRISTTRELTNATASVDADYRYGYAFDDIGNRETSSERGTDVTCAVNHLIQYTELSNSTVQPSTSNLQPLYDADGNQTLVKTATGTWQVTYNGENRPILWTHLADESNNQINQTNQTISQSFDRMGRRVTKNAQRFAYNGYLQVANYHLSSTNYHLFVWDPTEPVATRPLVWRRSALGTQHSALFYAHDGNKNVSEVLASDGSLAAHYEYAPFGAVTAQSGALAATNPWRFSSEYAEDDTATVYYNYRHYEPVMGRWLGRDPIEENGRGLYACCDNSMLLSSDLLGLEKKTFKYDTDPNSSWADAALSPSFKQESTLKKIYDEINVATTPYCPDGEQRRRSYLLPLYTKGCACWTWGPV